MGTAAQVLEHGGNVEASSNPCLNGGQAGAKMNGIVLRPGPPGIARGRRDSSMLAGLDCKTPAPGSRNVP